MKKTEVFAINLKVVKCVHDVILLAPHSPLGLPPEIQSGARRAPAAHSPNTRSSRRPDRNAPGAAGEARRSGGRRRGEDPPDDGFGIWRSPDAV